MNKILWCFACDDVRIITEEEPDICSKCQGKLGRVGWMENGTK